MCGTIRPSVSLAVVVGCLIAGSVATPTWAQRYKTIPAIPRREAQALQRAVSSAIRSPSGFGSAADDVTKYFTKYYFPKMTSIDSVELGELGDRRNKLFKQFVRATANADSQAELTKLCLKVARVLAIDNYHPAVRYNAALIIGNLDSRYATGGTNAQPPLPLPEATALLLDIVEKPSFDSRGGKKIAVHPAVKAGALVGLERHARYGVDARYAERLSEAALAVIAAADPPEDMDLEVHQWMRCQAAAVLAQQFKASPNAQLQEALNSLATDDTFNLDDRCYATRLMKGLEYAQAQGIDAPAALEALGSLSRDVLQKEAKLAEEYQTKMLEGGGAMLGRRGGGRNFNPDDEIAYERRRLLSRLRSIHDAGTALKGGVSPDAQAKLTNLLDAMQPARTAAADDDSTDLEIAERVIDAKSAVENVLESWGGGEVAEEDLEPDFS